MYSPLHILRDRFQRDTAYNVHLAESLQNSFFLSFNSYRVERDQLQRKNSQGPTRKFPTLQRGPLIKNVVCISWSPCKVIIE